jgi:hypothetical protein
MPGPGSLGVHRRLQGRGQKRSHVDIPLAFKGRARILRCQSHSASWEKRLENEKAAGSIPADGGQGAETIRQNLSQPRKAFNKVARLPHFKTKMPHCTSFWSSHLGPGTVTCFKSLNGSQISI